MAAARKVNAGREFTPTVHHHPEGAIDPSKIRLPSPFVVLVIAGSRGIGLGIAIGYARAGASTIIIIGRSKASLDAAALEVKKANSEVTIIPQQCDATDESAVNRLAEELKSTVGRLDVLAVNIGAAQPTIVKPDTGVRDWPWCISRGAKYSDFVSLVNINLSAVWLCIHSFMPLLEQTKDGAQAIIATTSTAAHYVQAEVMPVSYSLSKFAATRLIEHVHSGHHRSGITAFALQPGGVRTDMASDLPEGKGWDKLLIDSPELAGGMCVWLTKTRRDWLSGRYIDARWDVHELEERRAEITDKDLFKFRMDFE